MNSRNDYVREYLGVSAWHSAGYTGKRASVLTGEKIGRSEHGDCTQAAFREIAPDAALFYAPFPGYANTVEEFAAVAEHTGACTMFVSLSSKTAIAYKNADAAIPERLFCVVSAGNSGETYANAYMTPESVYGIGAVNVFWSAMTGDGTPAEGAFLKVGAAPYTSDSDLVDFAAPTGLWLDGYGKFDGTSCSAPVLAGMACLVNDLFIEKTGKPLTHKAMYQFLKDCAEDVHLGGEDDLTGWGVPRLPAPGKVNIKKYQSDDNEIEEEDTMSYNDFVKYMQQYESQRGAKPEPAWSKQEGAFAKAKKVGIMDGTRPEDPVKRDELAAVLDRLGLLDGDSK